jgi:hypothetical protein
MICERCGEVGETFMTEQYGELCEACQREVETQHEARRQPRRPQGPSEA